MSSLMESGPDEPTNPIPVDFFQLMGAMVELTEGRPDQLEVVGGMVVTAFEDLTLVPHRAASLAQEAAAAREAKEPRLPSLHIVPDPEGYPDDVVVRFPKPLRKIIPLETTQPEPKPEPVAVTPRAEYVDPLSQPIKRIPRRIPVFEPQLPSDVEDRLRTRAAQVAPKQNLLEHLGIKPAPDLDELLERVKADLRRRGGVLGDEQVPSYTEPFDEQFDERTIPPTVSPADTETFDRQFEEDIIAPDATQPKSVNRTAPNINNNTRIVTF